MNIAFSVLAVLAGLYWVIKGNTYHLWVNHGPGGGVFPVIAGGIVVIFGLIYLAGEWKKRTIVKFDIHMLFPVISVLAAVLAGCAIGLIPALAAFVILWLKSAEGYGWGKALGVGIGVGIFLYLIFVFWLRVPVPAGSLVELIFG